MPNARIQSQVANAGIRTTTPAAKTQDQATHSRVTSPWVNSRISQPNVERVVTTQTFTGGNSIGLLLALTYSTVTSTISRAPGGYGPHARIK